MDGSREESSAFIVREVGIEDIGYSAWIVRIGCRGVVDWAVGLIVYVMTGCSMVMYINYSSADVVVNLSFFICDLTNIMSC